LFTTWANEMIDQLWLKHMVSDDTAVEMPSVLYGGTAAPTHRHPITAVSPVNCTAQMGMAGPWHERLPHFRMAFTPSNGEELQSEYFVPRQHAVAAIKAVMSLSAQITPLLFISEIRSIAADDLWLSACYQQDCVALHFTWQPRWAAVREVLPLIEEALAPFEARPHWGKLFTVPAVDVRKLYPKMADFQQLLQHVDPQGKFRNAFVETYIL
ncbi:MAG: FAD-binding protein, partial [Anaerolineales bacterium]|nr:FAD-binding protein [Anaerolineales bacterium]